MACDHTNKILSGKESFYLPDSHNEDGTPKANTYMTRTIYACPDCQETVYVEVLT